MTNLLSLLILFVVPSTCPPCLDNCPAGCLPGCRDQYLIAQWIIPRGVKVIQGGPQPIFEFTSAGEFEIGLRWYCSETKPVEPIEGLLFSDDFESGDLAKWTTHK